MKPLSIVCSCVSFNVKVNEKITSISYTPFLYTELIIYALMHTPKVKLLLNSPILVL